METKKHKPLNKIVHLNEDGELILNELLEGTNTKVEDVEYYQIIENKDGSLKIALFDKNKELIKVKEKK